MLSCFYILHSPFLMFTKHKTKIRCIIIISKLSSYKLPTCTRRQNNFYFPCLISLVITTDTTTCVFCVCVSLYMSYRDLHVGNENNKYLIFLLRFFLFIFKANFGSSSIITKTTFTKPLPNCLIYYSTAHKARLMC